MRLTISLLVAAVLLAGCTSATPNVPPGTVSATMAEASTATATPTLPADTLPDTQPAEACPYLDAAWVAQTNGQRVTRVGVDTRFDPPACVFWSYSEDPQLTVLVRHMPSPDDAVAVVDWAAPIATTDPRRGTHRVVWRAVRWRRPRCLRRPERLNRRGGVQQSRAIPQS